jgi:hypothetical protein
LIEAGACGPLVEALKRAETVTKGYTARAIENLSNIQEGRAALIEAGACGPLVKALEDREDLQMILDSHYVEHRRECNFSRLNEIEDAKTLTKETIQHIVRVISRLSEFQEGRAALIEAGACGALVKALSISEDEETRERIARAIENLPEIQEAMARAERDVPSTP